MNSETVMVIGGAGFIGSYVCRKLIERDINVVVFDAFIQYTSSFDRGVISSLSERFKGIENKVEIVRGDARYIDMLEQTISKYKPQRIIHLAAMPISSISNAHIQEAIDSTIRTTANVLEVIKNCDFVKRFLYTSSSMVYGDFQYLPVDEEHPKNPKCIYGAAKYAGEIITQTFQRRFGINYTIIRPSAVYGPTDTNDRVVQLFIENAVNGREVVLRGADSCFLDFSYVDDVAEGFVLALFSDNAINQVFNITRGEGRSLQELINILRRKFPNIKLKYEEHDESKPLRGTLDISKARKLIDYNPKISLEEGVIMYIEYIMKKRRKE